MNQKKENEADMGDISDFSAVGAEESMNALILWNISKALQRNPCLDLKTAIKRAHERLDNTRDVRKIITQSPEERHLACALLAWQELGHSTAESLYRFIETHFDGHEREEYEKLTYNTKITILSPTDESENVKSLDHQHKTAEHPECIHKQKSLKEANSEICTHKGIKSNLGICTQKSENIKDSNNTHTKCAYLGNKDLNALRIKSSHKTSSKSNHKVSNKTNTYTSASNYCVLNNTSKTELVRIVKCPFLTSGYSPIYKRPSAVECVNCESCDDFDTDSLKGPVVSLPPDTKVVMRIDNQSTCARHQGKKPRASEKDVMSKIDAACCMDSACAERLVELDKATTELRNRAARLARREAERTELLERAEAAWRDLELGYQRRLALAEEKEYDIAKQTKKIIEDRNSYKVACMNLTKVLKERGDVAEKDRQGLVQVEKEMCALACVRMRTSEDAARSDAALTEQQIKVTQVDRDLQFKEEQTRRKLSGVESEVESVRALSIEAERAMRAELAALRDQVETVSKQLLKEDNENIKVKAELDSLRSEKLGLVQDLEGCQVSCDSRMQKKMDELKKGREKLVQLKDKVMECKCKIPIDVAVEVKRTPSLVALCSCAPEDRLLESCSCTSLRSQMLSNLLSDLFGGLQAELGDVAAMMPCQYLKCLEDKHNWDKPSLIKSNLRSYFAKLLIGELDIAIAISIEKYHARWVGISCVDTMRAIPDTDLANTEGWQERAIERRAQKLANKLAEQLFEERADKLIQRAKDAVKSVPPPCECKETAVFPCLVNPTTIGSGGFTESDGPIAMYWRKTNKDVTQLRVQMEEIKKESLKKEDLKLIEEKIFKLVKRPSELDVPSISKEAKPKELNNTDANNKDTKSHNRVVNTETSSKCPVQFSRPSSVRKKNADVTKKSPKKVSNDQTDRLNKNFKKAAPVQTFAVNTCFCDQNVIPKLISEDATSHKLHAENEAKTFRKQSVLKNSNQISSLKQSKPEKSGESTVTNIDKNKKLSSCRSGCICFHKIPSNTSIDKLLEKLTKWRCDLVEAPEDKSNIMFNYDTQNAQQQKCNNNVGNIPENKIKQYVSTDTNTIMLPNETESEYMGAINLDKSNDHCKCTVKQKKIDNKPQETNSIFQCINSELCECKKTTELDSETLNINTKNIRNVSSKRNKYTNELLENEAKKGNVSIHDGLNYKLPIEKVINDEIVNDKKSGETAINQIVKSSELFPCDCDYYVKLLGVTLADISSHKVFDDKHAISQKKNKPENKSNDEKVTIIKNSISNVRNEQIGDLNMQSCQCHVQFDQFKSYMENNFRKPWCDLSTNDKKLDVPSFKEISTDNDETCICCNKSAFNESQELEVNTFYLLEEHLRGKLEKLKKSCCKFSKLPAQEEEKLFSSILQQVKQVISTSANELVCKCKEEKQSDISWNRANTLLQEYLKTKIKKVQCLCADEDQKQECVLPKVLDEIYSLIEKDFQRLRNVYKFQKTNDNTVHIEVNNEDEEPEKDISDHEKNIDTKEIAIDSKTINEIDNLLKKRSLILKQSMSTQAFVPFGMNSKSCDAMEKEAKNIQTSQSIKSVVERNCGCGSITDCFSYETQDSFENNEVKMKNVSKALSSPYIGYTVDCSCKCALGTCTCIKSTVVKNNDEINNFWNDLTKDYRQPQINYQYIMNSLTNKHANQTIKSTGLENLAISTNNKNQISKNTESEFSGEEIILKDYNKKNVMVSNNSVNTSNINLDIYDIGSNDERYVFCECCAIRPILKTNNIRSETHLSNSINMHKTQSLSCDCNMVPVCHVKMLVDSLENRIFNLKCTCDSFNPRVCPIHSKRLY